MGPPRTGSREGAKYAKQHLTWRRGASPAKGPQCRKHSGPFLPPTRCLLRSICVHFSCGLRALPRSLRRSKLCRLRYRCRGDRPFMHRGRIDSASLAEAAQWARAPQTIGPASDVQCQVGLNDLATASALHSSVSKAIFCASMTSPGTSGWSGTKHQPAFGRPD